MDPNEDASDALENGRDEGEYMSSLLFDIRKLNDGG